MATCRLTERIVFERTNGSSPNENGFEVEQWEPIYECWASKEDINGKEFLQAYATHTEVIVGFVVRMCKLIKELVESYETKTIRIKYRDHYYDIKYARDINNQHSFAEFKCELIV